MKSKNLIQKDRDSVNIVTNGLIKMSDGNFVKESAPGIKTESPSPTKDTELSLNEYYGTECAFCESECNKGIWIVSYKERRIRKDKRTVDYVCINCMREKGISVKEPTKKGSGVIGFSRDEISEYL